MKIAVIGAGACGLYLAKNLAQRKHEVVVFEKKSTIGKKCCSGLFSARLFDFVPEARALATNRINACVINFPKKSIELRFRQPFFTLDHAQLDLLLATLAVQAGAQIRVSEKIDFTRLRQIEAKFDRVIGADGALSTVRAYLCVDPTPASKTRRVRDSADSQRPNLYKKIDLEFWLGIQGFEQKPDKNNFVETWATKNGFLWKIPRGEDIEWGIMENPESAPKIFNDFIARKNLQLKNIKSAIIPQGLVIPKNKKITLCGDASGLTKPWSGGGVVWNLTQADILLQNFPNFLQYRKASKRFFNLRIAAGKLAKFCAYRAGFGFPWIIPGKVSLDSDFLLNFFKK